jgi:hypothetical protein
MANGERREHQAFHSILPTADHGMRCPLPILSTLIGAVNPDERNGKLIRGCTATSAHGAKKRRTQ